MTITSLARVRIAGALLVAALAAGVTLADDGPAPAENSLDKRGGFRDAKLGLTLEDFRALDKAATVAEKRKKGGLTFYARSTDEMTLFGSTLERLEYGFKDGKLAAVVLRTSPEKHAGGAIDMYYTLPQIVRITAAFEDLLRDARVAKLDAIRRERLQAFVQAEYKAVDVKLDWVFEGRSVVAVVMPIRIDGTYPGEYTTQVVVLYLQKGLDLGEI